MKKKLFLPFFLTPFLVSPFLFLTNCSANPKAFNIGDNLGNTPSFRLTNSFSNTKFQRTIQYQVESPNPNSTSLNSIGEGGVMTITDEVDVNEDFLTIGTSMLNLSDWASKYGYDTDVQLATAVNDGMVKDIYLGFGQGGVNEELEFGVLHATTQTNGEGWEEMQDLQTKAITSSDGKTYRWYFTDYFDMNSWIGILLDEPVQNYFKINVGSDTHHSVTLTSTKEINFSVQAYFSNLDSRWGQGDGSFNSGSVYSTTASNSTWTEYTRSTEDTSKIQCMNIGSINSRNDLPTQHRSTFADFLPTSAKNFDVLQITGASASDGNEDYFQEFSLSTCTQDNNLYDQNGNIVGTTSYASATGFHATYKDNAALDSGVSSIYGFVNITDKRVPGVVMCKARLTFPVS